MNMKKTAFKTLALIFTVLTLLALSTSCCREAR